MNKLLFFSLSFFSVLFLPFRGALPYLDGNIDFVQVNDFYAGGLSQYFQNWNTVHPPLKLILTTVFFQLTGLNPSSYILVGFLFGFLGIIALFALSRTLFNSQVAGLSAFFLATSPLFLSTGIFSLRDYLLTVLILISLAFYSQSKFLGCALTLSLAILTKETGLILAGIILAIEALYFIKALTRTKRFNQGFHLFLFFIPFFTISAWQFFLKANQKTSWSEWLFTETSSQGTYQTILNNLITFRFLNQYAYQHWRQLFFLNFNWVYWLITLGGIFLFLLNKNRRQRIGKNLIKGTKKAKTLLVISLFFFGYLLTVLSLQTFTIPRYALPLIPFLLMTTALMISRLMIKGPVFKCGLSIFLSLMVFFSLFTSLDPVSVSLWGKTEILGEKLYALNHHLAGNDGITYNVQYLFLVKKRTREILAANEQARPVVSKECRWLFPDPRNDQKMIIILQLKNLNQTNLCLSENE